MPNVKVYGADWCHDTQATRKHLDGLGVAYEYFDIEDDPRAETWVKEQNGGKRKLPTVDVGGTILSVPNPAALDRALAGQGGDGSGS